MTNLFSSQKWPSPRSYELVNTKGPDYLIDLNHHSYLLISHLTNFLILSPIAPSVQLWTLLVLSFFIEENYLFLLILNHITPTFDYFLNLRSRVRLLNTAWRIWQDAAGNNACSPWSIAESMNLEYYFTLCASVSSFTNINRKTNI